jgi:CysZ protein
VRNNPIAGALYFLRGVRLLVVPGIRAYVIAPLAVNIVVFSALIYFGSGWFGTLLERLMDWLPNWLDWLALVLWPLFFIAVLIIVFFTFSLVGNLIAAPFNGLLAEAVECHLTGTTIPGGWKKMIADLGRTLASELRKLAFPPCCFS